jgi:hypothetical protein
VALQEAVALARDGEFDQAVERVVRWAEHDPLAEGQRAVYSLAKSLVKARKRQFKWRRSPGAPYGVNLAPGWKPHDGEHAVGAAPRRFVIKTQKKLCHFSLRCAGVTVQGVPGTGTGFITATGTVKVLRGVRFWACLILSCGSITLEQGLSEAVVVCDGDVSVRGALTDTLIVARGNVTLPSYVADSVVFAGGTITQGGIALRARTGVLRSKDTTGLGVIKFFDPAKVGIEMTADREGVKVKKAHKGKPFAAVVLAGDVVTAIGGARVGSPEVFRRRLRAALAEGTRTITLTVRGQGKEFDVRVPVRR